MSDFEQIGNFVKGRTFTWNLLITISKILKEFAMIIRHKVNSKTTRLVWTSFKIYVRHKLLTHNNTRLFTAYKKGNSKYYCFIMKKIDR